MEKTLESFKQKQAGTLKVLQELQAFLAQGEGFGISIDQNVKTKLDTAIRSVEDTKLRVVLVGGFSEGKTAIAAAWLERLDKSTMKISQEESSNAVTVYEVSPDCQLIDTPGLFGFKEQIDAQTNSIEKYKELTRKYVSEAHLVVYVMDPVNPIKESHTQELQWLFRTLNLLPRTVFVLSRFDAVADVEDERDYVHHFGVKKDNVTERLRDLIGLNDAEAKELAIVAVAANPFDMGTEHWLQNLETFRELSRIGLLQYATSEKVSGAGGIDAVVDETRRSIVRDVLNKQLPVAVQNHAKIAQEVTRLESMNAQLERQLVTAQGRIKDVRAGLRTFVSEFFTDLILQARGQTMDTFAEFFERNIGAEGIVLNANIQNAFELQTQSVKIEVSKMAVGLNAEVSHFNATVRAYGKQGIDYVVKGGLINNTSVLAARDGLVGAAKVVGLDLGKMLKFKPWGAVNLAKGLNGLLSAFGLALELWDSWEQAKRQQAFRDMIVTTVEKFEAQRKELMALVDGSDFEVLFFPEYVELSGNVDSIKKSVAEGQKKREQFQRWHESGKAIDTEFRMLDAA
ncbi:LeoA/HP0731 family dynamin-like GTPase [Cupriavidus sp. DL-D2]|jgi:GTP-binding protein EngB required for normal cell division|uniref:LeoA/HP0731 family dynamin-like GTPase n=1 Tax=Cupriavidus sp. DL-D2 TaxID=3144974 RepID=UPI00321220C6